MLRAGAAQTDITPLTPMFLVGYPHVERTSVGIHDPLVAAALCLENDGVKLILLALDLLFIDAETAAQWRAEIAHHCATRPEHVMISCTHTHSAPVTLTMLAWRHDPIVPAPDPDYMQLVRQQVLAAACLANQRLSAAECGWTTAQMDALPANRIDPSGPTDREIGLLAVRRRENSQYLAISLTYAMHPTVLHEDSRLVSADFPHYVRLALREQFGADAVVLYHTGTSGNQSPRHLVNGQTFEQAELLGRIIGNKAVEALSHRSGISFNADPPLASQFAQVELPLRDFPSPEFARTREREARALYETRQRDGAANGDIRTAECGVFGAEEYVTLADAFAQGAVHAIARRILPAPLQVLQIGGVSIVALPGEFFVEYGLRLKQSAPGKTFVISLANGELQGYIVTPEAIAVGGYEALNGLFGPEAGEILIARARQLQLEIQHNTAEARAS